MGRQCGAVCWFFSYTPRKRRKRQQQKKRNETLSLLLSLHDRLGLKKKRPKSTPETRHTINSDYSNNSEIQSRAFLSLWNIVHNCFSTRTGFLLFLYLSTSDRASILARFRSDLVSVHAVKTNLEYLIMKLNHGIGPDARSVRRHRLLRGPLRVVARHQ